MAIVGKLDCMAKSQMNVGKYWVPIGIAHNLESNTKNVVDHKCMGNVISLDGVVLVKILNGLGDQLSVNDGRFPVVIESVLLRCR